MAFRGAAVTGVFAGLTGLALQVMLVLTLCDALHRGQSQQVGVVAAEAVRG